MKGILKKLLPDFLAILIFVVLSFAYFSPVIEGKVFAGNDISHFKGMEQELVNYENETGKEALWTNSGFGGMPAYQIKGTKHFNIYHSLQFPFRLWLPYFSVGMLFVYLLGFYLMMRVLKVKPLLSGLGAISYAFISYNLVIIMAGHVTKAYAIGYIPLIVAGFILNYKGKYIWGGLLIAFSLGIQISVYHYQITYYTLMLVGLFVIIEFIRSLKIKNLKQFYLATGVSLLAIFLAIAPNIKNIWSTYEYVNVSTRGNSELTTDQKDKTKGLDKSYILNDYSYGILETMTILIPNVVGGPSNGSLPENSKVASLLLQNGYPQAEVNKVKKSFPTYFGPQRFTAGPVYIGAISIFLFVLGLFLMKKEMRWWLLTAFIFSIMLAWGKHFEFLADLFINYFPLYSKFRTVSMILILVGFIVPFGAIKGLSLFISPETDKTKKTKALKNAFIFTAGISLIFLLFGPGFITFSSSKDANMANVLVKALTEDRISLMRHDALRALIFVSFATLCLYLFLINKLKANQFLLTIGVLVLIDLWSVSKRYVNNDNFVSKNKEMQLYQPTQADLEIMKDTSIYRVFNLTLDPFNDASTSYYHHSIGGYHAAKIKRYQELIENHISKNNMDVLNMLNTKYFIIPSEDKTKRVVRENPESLGNVWFADSILWAGNADEEINYLNHFNPSTEVVVNQKFKSYFENNPFQKSKTGDTIFLAQYYPDRLVYYSKSKESHLAVFSEIYYPTGWHVTIDGVESNHIQTNYVLRAMVIPEGEHKIEFSFKPSSIYIGSKISMASSILMILLLGGAVFWNFYKKDDN